LSKLGRGDEAINQLQLAIRYKPNEAILHTALGQKLELRGRYVEALSARRQVVALKPKDPIAQNGVRAVLVQLGRVDEALLDWQKAIEANPLDHAIWHGYPEFCLFLGREREYRDACRTLLARFGTTTAPDVAARVARACLLSPIEGDELRQAVALADRAVAADRKEYPYLFLHFLFIQGLAEYRQGHFDRAITAMRGDASEVFSPDPRLVLAMALHQSGQVTEARKTFAEAIGAYDWRANRALNRDGWIYHILRREAECMILPDLPAFLNGKHQPQDNDERIALVGVCQFTARSLALARLYTDAFAADPRLAEDLVASHRYKAARAAAQTGCGRGADVAGVGDAERTRWRRQAREWLRADLTAWGRVADGDTAADRNRVRNTLSRWRKDPDLAGLHDPTELGKSPQDRASRASRRVRGSSLSPLNARISTEYCKGRGRRSEPLEHL